MEAKEASGRTNSLPQLMIAPTRNDSLFFSTNRQPTASSAIDSKTIYPSWTSNTMESQHHLGRTSVFQGTFHDSSTFRWQKKACPKANILPPPPTAAPGSDMPKKEMGYALCFPLAVLLSFFFLLFVDVPIPSQPFSIFFSIVPSSLYVSSKDHHRVCDYSHGRWVWDQGYGSKFYGEDCPFLDPGFQCRANGRKDAAYLNWRWQPYGCDLPTFNASDMLERSRNRKIIFAGDSIGRNQWESLVCMLAKAAGNRSRIFEKYGSPITKHWGFLSMVFQDYNLTVEYYRTPYLVVVGRPPAESPSQVRRTIRLDVLAWQSKRWADADVLILNAGHWWNEDKTAKSGSYFQVGRALNMTMDVKEAFGRTLQTVKEWTLRNLKQENSYFFFRSYAPSHYSNGTWDNGGSCHADTAPETKASALEPEPWNNEVISDMIEEMKGDGRQVQLLNITYSTGFRKDGHPSRHREPGTPGDAPQDCSHWCLPGVPDMWNELLYAHLLSMGYDTKRKSDTKKQCLRGHRESCEYSSL